MTPFTIAIPDADIADLKRRLAATRWPDEVEGAGWDYGISLPWLQRFVAHWQAFDWRSAEARLNRFPQFTAEVDGETVHFVHVKGKGANPTPLLLANGWPSNFVELLPLVPLLTAEQDGVSYDVIIPSLPGYGFSGKPKQKGMNLSRISHLWAKLMANLGYDKYLTSGSDLGAGVLFGLTRNYPDRLLGVHFSNTFYGYPRPADPTPEEQAYFQQLDQWTYTEAAYAMEQATKPTTLAVGLTDSPAGLAAWILEKFWKWGDTKGEIESAFSLDDLATIVSVYWYTGTIGSSVRLYKEVGSDAEMQQPMPPHQVPHAVTAPAGGDIAAPRRWAERNLQHLIHFTQAEWGGHFPALETPEFFAGEIRAFHREIVKHTR